MKWLGAAVLMLAVCGMQPALADRRGSVSPSAPITVTQHVPEQTPAGVSVQIELRLDTPMTSGELIVEVAKQQGLSVQGPVTQRFDLGSVARPIVTGLEVVPSADAERYLVLLLSVDTPLGPMSRNIRISLPGEPLPQPEGDAGMKIMPSEPAP